MSDVPGPAELVSTWRAEAAGVLVGKRRSTMAVQGAIDISRAHTLNQCADQLESAMRQIGVNMLAAHGVILDPIGESGV